MKQKIYHILKYIFLLLVLIGILVCSDYHYISISNIKCNYKDNPVGISRKPQFSWMLESEIRNQFQTAYHLLVADHPEILKKDSGNLWDTKKVDTNKSINIIYNGQELIPGKEYYWKVKVWDKNDRESEWSKQATFVTALYDSIDWSGAKWIGIEDMEDSLRLVPGIPTWGYNTKGIAVCRPIIPLLRKEFSIAQKIESAYLFISGLGHYKAYINGNEISDDFLSPGWTNYDKTCLYNTYNVTKEIQKGDNAIGIIVGNGFYNVNNERYRKLLITYGMPKAIAKLQINYIDGTTESVVTGADWKTAPSPIIYTSIYGGETYDARMEQPDWNKPGFDDSDWQNVLQVKPPKGKLTPETTYPVRFVKTYGPMQIQRTGIDTFMFDFGQNASGIVEIKVKGKKGDTIRIYPSELFREKFKDNQRFTGPPHYYEYILKGESIEIWKPRFSYYGLRYAHVIGAEPSAMRSNNSLPELLDITMLHNSNTSPIKGSFWCSNPLFNQIDTLIRFGIKSNMQSVLTDCPHREKLGWIEQTYLMGNSIQYNYEVYHLYCKLVHDMMDSQRENGLIPNMAPEFIVFGDAFTDSPEWGSAIIMVPYFIYKWYGDITLMEEAWESMLKYIQYLDLKAEKNIISYGLGDWYDLGPELPGFPQLSPIASTATAVYFQNYKYLAILANELGKDEYAAQFVKKAEKIRKAYNKHLFKPDKAIYATGSQSAMAIPLSMGIVKDEYRDQVLQNLVDSILTNNKSLTAGDIGFHYLIDALTKGNQSQLLYEMNNRDDIPGYGYQIKKGATALTESWDALARKSNNHLMLGHLEEWLYTGLGGIRQEENSKAFKNIIINPTFIEGLEEVKTSYQSVYGNIQSKWKKTEAEIIMSITIPVNTTAKFFLSANIIEQISESNKSLDQITDIEVVGTKEEQVVIKVGSGSYNFIIKK
ncbi:family 78 glycoside hydrolase catalytic domain [Bacteroidota bacterium]